MAKAKKYSVGKISRKDLLAAIEHLMCDDDVNDLVRINSHRGKKYEIRVVRLVHGVQLKWGLPGTFYTPNGYANA